MNSFSSNFIENVKINFALKKFKLDWFFLYDLEKKIAKLICLFF